MEPGTVLMCREDLCKSTYRKIWVDPGGDHVFTTLPVSVLLGDKWRFWKIGDSKNLYVAYDHTDQEELNAYWEARRSMSRRIPKMWGTLVFFRWENDIDFTWNALNLHVSAWLYGRYIRDHFSARAVINNSQHG